jgi:hypothetical protein
MSVLVVEPQLGLTLGQLPLRPRLMEHQETVIIAWALQARPVLHQDAGTI